MRQPFLPIDRLGKAINHDVYRAFIKAIHKNQARHPPVANEVLVRVEPAFDLAANLAQLIRAGFILHADLPENTSMRHIGKIDQGVVGKKIVRNHNRHLVKTTDPR